MSVGRSLLPHALPLAITALPLAVALVLPGRLDASAVLAWLGSGAIAASLLLMVREPAFAAWFGGLERMYRFHHALGTIGYVLLLAHPLAIAARALPADPMLAWHALDPSGQGWVGALGWLALVGLMLGLGATFAMRLPYATWRWLHALLGFAVLAGVAHAFAAEGASPVAWVFAIPVAAGLGWRALRADRGVGARPYTVVSVSHPARDMTELRLAPLARPLVIAPGQFVMVALFAGPHFRGCGEYHPFTVSGIGDDGTFAVTVKELGDCTRHVQSLEPGVAARVQGPFGTFLQQRAAGRQLWVAGGIGIAAFMAALRAGRLAQPVELIYLYRDPADAAYVDELAAVARGEPLLTLHARAAGDDPAALAAELARVPAPAWAPAYVCGPPGMIAAARTWLAAHGIPNQQIHSERFDFR